MVSIDEITRIEDRYAGPAGKPALGEAYWLLRERWMRGERDRETGLRLLFLSWYSCAEPTRLTGLPDDARADGTFREVYTAFGGEDSEDPEFLHVAGYMAEFQPFCIGEEDEWKATGLRCLERASELRPQGFRPEEFKGRGAYGDYFAHYWWVKRENP
jgi:hypothetical protein